MNASSEQKFNNIVLEDVKMLYRNFSGRPSRYNKEGARNFCVLLPKNVAEKLILEGGWRVRWLEPRDPEDEKKPFIQVKVNFNNPKKLPRIIMISTNVKTELDESSVNVLDWAEIGQVDMILAPYQYDVSGSQGVAAYLKSMYVTIIPDVLEEKYREVLDDEPTV